MKASHKRASWMAARSRPAPVVVGGAGLHALPYLVAALGDGALISPAVQHNGVVLADGYLLPAMQGSALPAVRQAATIMQVQLGEQHQLRQGMCQHVRVLIAKVSRE